MHFAPIVIRIGLRLVALKYAKDLISRPDIKPGPYGLTSGKLEDRDLIRLCLENEECLHHLIDVNMGGSASKPPPPPELKVIHKNQVDNSSGFHMLEIHGTTAGIITLIAIAVMVVIALAFFHHVKAQRKRIKHLVMELQSVRRAQAMPPAMTIYSTNGKKMVSPPSPTPRFQEISIGNDPLAINMA